MSLRFLFSCGEPSGDLYAGALARELRVLDPGVQVAGLGGPALAAAGGRLIADYRGSAVTGLTETLGKIPRLLRTVRQLVEAARTERPDALVVIDFPDFNLRLASRIKRLGIPVIYYVAPQIWAWRASRLETIRRLADRVLVIFPFEPAIYEAAGMPREQVEFVGHPLIDLIAPSAPRPVFLAGLGLDAAVPTIALLPGSRSNEVYRILPDLLAAGRLIRAQLPAAQFVVARAPGLDPGLFAAVPDTLPGAVVASGEADAILAAADVAVTASGTATVQAALHDTPMVIVYRLSPWTYRLGRRFVKLDTFGMVNLIAGERVAPELIQDALTPEAVAREALTLLTDAHQAARMREHLARVRSRLGGGGASARAARAIVDLVSAFGVR